MPRQDKGFTLVEVLIVVFLIGILAAVLVPTFSPFQDEQKLIGASSELASALRFASSEAKKTKIPLRFEIIPATEEYMIKVNATNALIYHPTDKKPYKISFDENSMYSGVDIAAVSGGSDVLSFFVFNTRGTIAADTKILLQNAGHSRVIYIYSATGRVFVME